MLQPPLSKALYVVNMLTKVETSGFLLGITAVCFELIVFFNRQYAPTYLLEFFRGGNTGGVIVGLALILGFISEGV